MISERYEKTMALLFADAFLLSPLPPVFFSFGALGIWNSAALRAYFVRYHDLAGDSSVALCCVVVRRDGILFYLSESDCGALAAAKVESIVHTSALPSQGGRFFGIVSLRPLIQ